MNLKIHTFVVQYRRELSALSAGLATLICLSVLRPHPAFSVVTAAHDLPAGHIIQAGDLTSTSLNAGWPSAMTSASDLIGKTLTHSVRTSTPINSNDLLDTSMTKDLHVGMRAVSIDISATDSTLAAIGSRVDVFSAEGQQISSNSLVLALNSAPSSGLSLGSNSQVSAIVAMSRTEVSQLASARNSGALTLAMSGN